MLFFVERKLFNGAVLQMSVEMLLTMQFHAKKKRLCLSPLEISKQTAPSEAQHKHMFPALLYPSSLAARASVPPLAS